MLACENLTVRSPEGQSILRGARARFEPGAMNALIGPSGCGKTTLVKALLGLIPATGEVFYEGQAVKAPGALAGRVGFAPQFSIAHPKLTVAEALAYTLRLFVDGGEERSRRLEAILNTVGLAEHRETCVEALSGGQLRRLGLGLELTLNPACLICDEVTSGLDPNSEEQILSLLDNLRREQGKTFICIIHNLAKLDRFDCITVVHAGSVIFQGSLPELHAWFGITDALHLYDVLSSQEADDWSDKWAEQGNHRDSASIEAEGDSPPEQALSAPQTQSPSAFSQFTTLLARRGRLFLRDRGYLLLTVAITLGFPCMVVVFALDGLPQIRGLALDRDLGVIEEMKQTLSYNLEQMKTAQLVTGLIMFQVILLTLIGANNGGREIAAERKQFEKERFCGLSAAAYAGSKIVFTAMLAVAQGAWMGIFVKVICDFPGPWLPQLSALALTCMAMTLVSLGFSAVLASAEKASLLSIYLVGFQLPLSGVVLALPETLVWLCRPFITAYWGWAGYLGSMRETRLYDAFRLQSTEWLAMPVWALLALLAQALVGIALVYYGTHKRQNF